MERVDLKWELNEVEIEEEEVGGLLERTSKAINGKIETNGHANSTPKISNGTEKSDLGDEQERLEEQQQLSDSNNGVEVEEEAEPKEESILQAVVSNNGVEVEEETEAEEESVQQIEASNNGVEEGTDPKEESIQQIVPLNNGVEEGTEQKEESVQQLVASNNGVEKGTEAKEESILQTVVLNNGVEVEEGIEPKDDSVQQIVPSNNGVEEGTEQKEESVQQIVASNDGVEEGTEAEEESIQQIVAKDNGVEEGIEAKEESPLHLLTSTDGVDVGTEAEEGPFRSGHSVYHDKDEGIWKCRACSWTLQGKSLGIGWTKIPRGHLDKLMNYPMLDQRGLLFSFGSKDSNFTSTPSIKEKIDKNPGDEGVQAGATLDIQLNGYLKSDNLSSSSAQPSKDLLEDHSIVHNTAIDEIESAETDLINDSDTDVKDFDVENVLQKQNTHDLYCPKCKSCITRRVILRKRKRKIPVPGDDVKRNKLEAVVDSKVEAGPAHAADHEVRDGADSSLDGTPPLATDDYQTDREPEVFRCLSCFSFFIRTGNGFLSRIFGGENGNVKGKASVQQGSGIGASAAPAYSNSEITQEAGAKILGSENQDANMKGKMVINTVGKSENATKSREGGSVFDIFDVETRYQPDASASSKEVQENDRKDELLRTTGRIQVSHGNLVQESQPASNDRKDELLRTGGKIQVSNGNLVLDSDPASQQNEVKLLITSTKEESLTIEKSETDLKSDVAIPSKGPGGSVLDIFDLETRNQPDTSASSKEVQENDRNNELLRTTDRIQVSNGNLVQESQPASNDRKDELLRTGGKIQVSNGNLVQDSDPASQQNEVKLLITSTKEESLTIEKSETDLKSDVAIPTKGPAFALNGLDGNGKPKLLTEINQEHEQLIEAMIPSESLLENNDNKFQLSSKDGVHHYEVSQHTITTTNIEILSKQPLKVDEQALISSVKDALSIQDKQDNITDISVEAAANSIAAGNHTIITVEPGPETTETAPANSDAQIHSFEGQGADAAEVYRIEIIKSIVWGGLAESVTSLSVVASATGGDTSTLNILVLAMANLVGGLFIIFHNLWELKRNRFEQASNQIMEEQVDQYREQLGRRENFTLHAVLVVLSYIIFGLVPPVVYGFSFHKSDDKELKIVSVAAASLVCILMLATGKAYVQKGAKPYFKTISAYLILGFTVSGVSYAAGILFKRLLEKLGLFQPSSTVNLFLPDISGTGAAWASI